MDFWFLIDALFLFAGCYIISLGVRVKLSGDLKDLRSLMPKYAHPARCKNVEGFIHTVLPWLLLFGAATAISGLLSIAQDMSLPIPDALHWAGMAFFVITAVLYLKIQRDAIGKYWNEEDQPDQLSEQARKAKREAKKARKGK